MNNFISLSSKKIQVFKNTAPEVFNDWTTFSNKYDCAMFAEERPLLDRCNGMYKDNVIESLAFDINDSISPKDAEDNKVLIVCGEIYCHLLEGDKISKPYLPDWKRVRSLKGLELYLEELSPNRPIYIFYEENNFLPDEIRKYRERQRKLDEYLNRKVYFKGDIIITDPGYVIMNDDLNKMPRKELFLTHNFPSEYDDFDGNESKTFNEELKRYNEILVKNSDNNEFFEPVEYIGFKKETIGRYIPDGNCSYVAYNTENKTNMGKFSSNSGFICVFNMEDVRKYNPDFETQLKTKPWIATIINNFEGDIGFEEDANKNLIIHGTGNIEFKTKKEEM